MVSDQELLLSHHLDLFQGIGEMPAAFRKDAEAIHILRVDQAIRDLASDVLKLTTRFHSADAIEFVVFGIIKRLQVLSKSFRSLTAATFQTPRGAKELEEIASIDRDLNSLYINLLGIFDNYAWAIVYEFAAERVDLNRKSKVGLFRRGFWEKLDLTALSEALRPHDDWVKLLKERRDPVAHRIPLSVPPAVLDDAGVRRYYQLEEDYWRYRAGRDMEMAEDAKEQQAMLGDFEPIFKHHSREAATPMYPTVPEDCAGLVTVCRTVNAFIRERCAGR